MGDLKDEGGHTTSIGNIEMIAVYVNIVFQSKKQLHEALKPTSFRFELTIFRNRVTKR